MAAMAAIYGCHGSVGPILAYRTATIAHFAFASYCQLVHLYIVCSEPLYHNVDL